MTARSTTALTMPSQKAEELDDLGFLINHTITCLITDIIELPIKSWWTSARHPEKNDAPTGIWETAKQKLSTGGLLAWAVGEGLGDMLAVPATLSVQKYAPELMNKIGELLHPVLDKPYRASAQKAADIWAKEHEVAIGSVEHHEYAQHHYDKEMRHAPQAFVWTAASLAIALPIQKHALPKIVDKLEELLPQLEQQAPHWVHHAASATLENLGEHENQSYLKLLQGSILGKTLTYAGASMPRLMFPQSTDRFEHTIHELFAPDHKLDSIEYQQKITHPSNLEVPALA